MPEIEVRRSDTEGRYEAVVDGAVAGYAEFRGDGEVVTLPHTVVEDGYEGQGIGSVLVRETLDDLRARGARVRPTCPFVRSWLDRHPGYADLVVD